MSDIWDTDVSQKAIYIMMLVRDWLANQREDGSIKGDAMTLLRIRN